MRNSRRHPSSRPASVLGLCLGLFLAAQWLEAGHFHDAGWQAPDCVQCQLDTSQALAEEVPASTDSLALYTPSTLAPESAAISAAYRLNARGPPRISN